MTTLTHLTDSALIEDLKTLVRKEKDTTYEILKHISEVGRRRLYCDYKCSSLFEFCTKVLGYSESSAQRRIQSARLMERSSEVREGIKTGSLTTTQTSILAGFLGKNKNEEITPLIALAQSSTSTRDLEKKLCSRIGEASPPSVKEKIKVKSEKTLTLTLEFTEAELNELQENAREEHLTLKEYILKLSKDQREKKEKKKFGITMSPRAPQKVSKDARYISQSTRRTVYASSSRKCEKCGTKNFLEFDHITPYALGGKSVPSNLRLLCRSCNQRARIQQGLSYTPHLAQIIHPQR